MRIVPISSEKKKPFYQIDVVGAQVIVNVMSGHLKWTKEVQEQRRSWLSIILKAIYSMIANTATSTDTLNMI